MTLQLCARPLTFADNSAIDITRDGQPLTVAISIVEGKCGPVARLDDGRWCRLTDEERAEGEGTV